MSRESRRWPAAVVVCSMQIINTIQNREPRGGPCLISCTLHTSSCGSYSRRLQVRSANQPPLLPSAFILPKHYTNSNLVHIAACQLAVLLFSSAVSRVEVMPYAHQGTSEPSVGRFFLAERQRDSGRWRAIKSIAQYHDEVSQPRVGVGPVVQHQRSRGSSRWTWRRLRNEACGRKLLTRGGLPRLTVLKKDWKQSACSRQDLYSAVT